MERNEAYAALPAGAVWSCSFGYPGNAGYAEYWREPDGTRWVIENGLHNPQAWAVRRVPPLQH